MGDQPAPMCPFLKQACIKARCQLYQELPIAGSGPLVGTVRSGMLRGCSITLAAFFLGRLNNLAAPPGPGPRPTAT